MAFPSFVCPKSVLDDFEYRHLRLKGIKVRPNTIIGGAIGIDDLFRDGYKAIFIGTGVWQPNTLHIKGGDTRPCPFWNQLSEQPGQLSPGRADHCDRRRKRSHGCGTHRHAQRCALLQCFSRDEGVAASKHEFEYAVLEGVEFCLQQSTCGNSGRGRHFADMVKKEDGTWEVVPGSEQLYPADSVIISISQGPLNRIVNSTKGIDTNARGLIEADESGHTTRPGIFCIRRCGQRCAHSGGGCGSLQTGSTGNG